MKFQKMASLGTPCCPNPFCTKMHQEKHIMMQENGWRFKGSEGDGSGIVDAWGVKVARSRWMWELNNRLNPGRPG